MKILLQFPEGLKQKALEYAKKYESEGHEVFLSASACYGACDICLDEARWLEADKIVHFGHNRFMKKDLPIPVEYIEYNIDIEIDKLKEILQHIGKYEKIGLATTVQHLHQFDKMKEFFEKNGKRIFAEKGANTEIGQVLGCDAAAVTKVKDKVDAVVFVGSGMFHPLAMDIGKPVFVYNPYDNSVKELSKEIGKLKARRKGAIAKALSCKRFAILASTKPGQFNIAQAKWAKQELDKRGFETAVLVANELVPLTLNNFTDFQCFVNTACPRMADDEFGKPVLTIDMLKQLLRLLDQ